MPPEPKPLSREQAGNTLPADPQEPATPVVKQESVAQADAPSEDKKGDNISKEEYEKVLAERDRSYARAKRAEGRLKEKGISLEDEPPQTPQPKSQDPFSLAKTVNVLRDYDATEIDMIQSWKGGTQQPEEVVKDQNFQIWLKGKRDADLKIKNAPSPSGSSQSSGIPDPSEIGKMTKEEHAKLEREIIAKQKARGI